MRDNWASAIPARYTVGVWVGNFSGAPMHDVSGVRGAAPVWREVMDFLHEGDPQPPAAPAGLVRQRVALRGRHRAGARGMVPRRHRDPQILPSTQRPAGRGSKRPRAARSRDRSRHSAARQRVVVTVAGAPRGARLRIGAANLPADAAQLWKPVPGRHVLRLVDEKGAELDRVQVTVRGASRCENIAAVQK